MPSADRDRGLRQRAPAAPAASAAAAAAAAAARTCQLHMSYCKAYGATRRRSTLGCLPVLLFPEGRPKQLI